MNKRNSIDDFTLRRRLPAQRAETPKKTSGKPPQSFADQPNPSLAKIPLRPRAEKSAALKSEIDASLTALDDEKRSKKSRRFWPPSKKFFKRLLAVILLVAVLVLAYLGVRAFVAGSQVVGGNILDLFSQGKPLKADENGRSNVLIFGTSEDDRAHDDAGPHLTDSIMLASIDQKKNKVMLTSVPRDLWVKYGEACSAGYEGKINALYQCASNDGTNEKEGAQRLMNTVGDVYGLKMHYYVHVNYTALKEAVDAIGGIDIVIESEDPRGILDRNFDWECNYQCYLVKYPNGPAHLDGKQALALARARNSSGGYGLERSNFDRERNQQKILIALREKAASVGTLANPAAVSQLLDALGKNVRTSFEAGEMRTLINVAQAMKAQDTKTVSLDTEGLNLITSATVSGQSVVQPALGLYDFSGIHAYILKQISNDPIVTEEAKIDVLNGSGIAGVAQQSADALATKKFIINEVSNAPQGNYASAQIYQLNKEKNGTKQKLEEFYNTKVTQSGLPAGVTSSADFVIIIGAASNTQQ